MDFVDRKGRASEVSEGHSGCKKKFVVVYGGAVWANRRSSNLSSLILMSNDEVHLDF